MVDLREALRPFVDEPSVGPRPLAEIAARARRRRVRRWSTTTGIAACVVALVIAVGRPDTDDGDGVATVNGPDPTTTTSAPATPTTTTAPPVPPADGLTATPGISAAEQTTSSWDGGRCIEVQLENTTGATVTWEVSTTTTGTITEIWNAVPQDDGKFTGDQWNAKLAPGMTTTFGYCDEG